MITNIKALGLVVSDDNEILSCFPYISLCKTHEEHNLKKNLVEVHYMMQHTKYQGSRPLGFRQEDFLKFSS